MINPTDFTNTLTTAPRPESHDLLLRLEKMPPLRRWSELSRTGLYGQAPGESRTEKTDWTMNRIRLQCGVLDDLDQISGTRAAWCLTWAQAVLDGTEHQTDDILARACRIIFRHSTDERQRNTAVDLHYLITGDLP